MTSFTARFRAKIRYGRRMLALLIVLLTVGCSSLTAEQATPVALVPRSPTAAPTAPATVLPIPSATAVPTAPAATVPAPSATPGGVAALAFSGQRALADVRWLAETIGSRPAGSDAERQAAEGLASRLAQLGYDTTLQPFTMRRFEDRGSTLHVREQPDLALDGRALQYSAPGTVSGRLVDVGRGQDLGDRDLRGAIALIERGDIPFAEKARNVAAAGAVGAIIYNHEPGRFQGTLGEVSDIPVVALSNAEGQQLVQLLRAEQLTVELAVDAAIVEAASQNVVATLPGSTDETIVLGAHYDSVAEGPGANDNGSGTATVLELARALSTADLPYTVEVVLFGAEEIGLVGSRHYVDTLAPSARERIGAMLNFDMVGVGTQLGVAGSAELVDLAREAAEQDRMDLAMLGSGLNGRSDHASFLDAGIPTIFFHRSEDPNYHTADDRAEYVDAANLEAAGRLATTLLSAIASAPTVP